MLVLGLAFLAYGLWAENRLLIWRQVHPDYVRAAGPWTERLEVADTIAELLWMSTGFAFLFYQAKRARLNQDRQQKRRADVPQPFSPFAQLPSTRWRVALGTLAGASIIFGFVFLAMVTETYVWEGWRGFSDLGDAYLLFWASLTALLTVARDAKTIAYGSSARPLSPDDENAIGQKVLAGDRIAAIQLYRRNTAGASLAEAMEFVDRVTQEIEARQPGEIAANRRALYRVRPKRLLIGLLIEVAIVGVNLSLIAPPGRLRWSLELIANALLGFAFGWTFQRIPRRWRFVISVVPWPILMFAEVMTKILVPEHYTFGAFIGGFMAGAILYGWSLAGQSADQRATIAKK